MFPSLLTICFIYAIRGDSSGGELDMVQLDKELALGAQQSASESSPQSTSATAEVQHG